MYVFSCGHVFLIYPLSNAPTLTSANVIQSTYNFAFAFTWSYSYDMTQFGRSYSISKLRKETQFYSTYYNMHILVCGQAHSSYDKPLRASRVKKTTSTVEVYTFVEH